MGCTSADRGSEIALREEGAGGERPDDLAGGPHPPTKHLSHGLCPSPARTHTELGAPEPGWLPRTPSAHGSQETPGAAPGNTQAPCPTLPSCLPAGEPQHILTPLLGMACQAPHGWKGVVGSEGPQAGAWRSRTTTPSGVKAKGALAVAPQNTVQSRRGAWLRCTWCAARRKKAGLTRILAHLWPWQRHL